MAGEWGRPRGRGRGRHAPALHGGNGREGAARPRYPGGSSRVRRRGSSNVSRRWAGSRQGGRGAHPRNRRTRRRALGRARGPLGRGAKRAQTPLLSDRWWCKARYAAAAKRTSKEYESAERGTVAVLRSKRGERGASLTKRHQAESWKTLSQNPGHMCAAPACPLPSCSSVLMTGWRSEVGGGGELDAEVGWIARLGPPTRGGVAGLRPAACAQGSACTQEEKGNSNKLRQPCARCWGRARRLSVQR
ncbi:MAG: hypothetical protein J3K34DRAFT_442613 [Monoraphidium minutum]|nr:MAG: hypothetical protein J3K34DRAFT_442613 [Monoraphidium minutum]